MTEQRTFDVIIVGGGIAGCALGANLARAGLTVEILERDIEYVDRVRGEWMAPWGVAEAKKLGLYDRFIAAGGHHIARAVNYDEIVSLEEAEANPVALGGLVQEIPGPLCTEHVVMQNVALEYATESGALVKRGVKNVIVKCGEAPSVNFTLDESTNNHQCRLIAGADGRSSTIRRQIGLELDESPVDHLISGLLVEAIDEWPTDTQSIGKAGDVMCLIFPQDKGKLRLYVDYGLENRGKFTGDKGAKNLLKAFDKACIRGGEHFVHARPIGPCRSYPSQSSSLSGSPFVDGVVLIGDAGGYTDPLGGQGLSNILRDVRLVRDILLDNKDWSPKSFEQYGEERSERIRRVIQLNRFGTTLFARFDPESVSTRTRAFARMAEDPELGELLGSLFTGPDSIASEYFTDDFYSRVFAP